MMEESKVLEQKEEITEASETAPQPEEAENKQDDKKDGKKGGRKLPLIIGALVLLVIAVAAALFLGSGKASPAALNTQPKAWPKEALLDEGYSAYLPLDDGSCIEIKDEVERAYLTPDRKHLVVGLCDGMLYVTDTAQSEKQVICENYWDIEYLTDKGFVYYDEDENMYRVLFSDYSKVELGEDIAIEFAENTLSLVCAYDKGVYTLAETESEYVKRGSWSKTVRVEAVSDDAQLCLWTVTEDNVNTTYLSEGDEKTKLFETEYVSKYSSGIVVSFSADQQTVVVGNLYDDSLWIKKRGEEPVKAKLSDTLASRSLYTEKGNIEDVNAGDIQSLYVSVDADGLNNLYHISPEGDRERVLNDVLVYSIADNKVVYQNDDGLYYAEVKAAELGEEERISGEAEDVWVSRNGKYVFYRKNVDDNEGTLYCYKLGEDEPVKVAGNVTTSGMCEGLDNGSLLFFKNKEEAGDSYYSYFGTLYSWAYGDEEANKIGGEVLLYTLDSGYSEDIIDINNFTYLKYTESIDGFDFGNLMHFDGKESTRLASDVSYDLYYTRETKKQAPAVEAPAARY